MKSNIIKVSDREFDAFPDEFDVTQMVFGHYYDIGYMQKQPDSLNDAQKALYYHFICDGLIDNSGFFSILLETNGEFNNGYSKALELIGDLKSKSLFDEIVSLYDKYESWFSKQQNPPVLDEESPEYNEELHKRIDEIHNEWYANGKTKEDFFKEYFKRNKHHLVEKQ